MYGHQLMLLDIDRFEGMRYVRHHGRSSVVGSINASPITYALHNHPYSTTLSYN